MHLQTQRCSHTGRHTHTQTSMRTHCYERVGEKHAHAGTSICTYMYANTYPASSSTLDMQAHTLRASSSTLDICTYMYANTYPALLSTLDMQAHTSRASSSTLDMHAGTRIDMGWTKHPELSVQVARECPYQIKHGLIRTHTLRYQALWTCRHTHRARHQALWTCMQVQELIWVG